MREDLRMEFANIGVERRMREREKRGGCNVSDGCLLPRKVGRRDEGGSRGLSISNFPREILKNDERN